MGKNKSEKFNFTMSRLNALEPGPKRKYVFDSKQPGLRVSVTKTGVKSFQFQAWSKTLGKPLTRTLGRIETMSIAEARKQAAALLAEINQGTDIERKKQDEKRQRQLEPTVKEFAVEYIEKYAKINKKSWKEDQRILNVNILPVIGSLKMSEVKRRDLIAVIDNVADRGSLVMANRTHALLSKMFNYAMERDVIELSPVYGMKKRTSEKPRERILSDTEIVEFWNALGSSPGEMILKMILATGQRPGEVRLAEWTEIQIQNALWTIPSDKTKNNLTHVVPLNEMAIEIIKQMKLKSDGSRYVFPGKSKQKPLTNTSPIHRMQKIILKLGWTEKATPHDLRRTVRTNLAKLGINKIVAERLLNHKEQGISATYDRHDYLQEKTAALSKWNNRLKQLLTGKEGKVIKIREAV
ncbi:integrase [Desulfolithobacter dissulfuricans]|uniref:Integrase n=1 Tax=Desulfolithobacter dissulfuricans TaxID=2795293 RepID=A0A915XJE3_9BACT|nr:site-specific integrase [Desulfolithobacter dissulfuricans]BCO08592.1 integrase [Desulfolithobacter dissulfuricans]